MGMSSSQARLLTLTARMHQIEYKAAKVEAMKLQMANESARVYDEYLNALETTKIQHKSIAENGSITYNDVTYADLCLGGINGFDISSNTNNNVLIYGGGLNTNSAGVGEQYGLFDINSGKMYVPKEIADAYENSSNASEFASALSNYIPSAAPNTNPSTNDDSDTPVNPDNPFVDPSNNDPDTPVNPVDPPTDDPDIPEDNPQYSVSLNMGEYTTENIPAGEENEIILILKNTYNGGDNKYKISSQNSDETATFKYLANGRLLIQGNNLTITAEDGQIDDIILVGNNNTLSTGDGNDKIRVGGAMDSSLASYNSYANAGNTINAGAGDDYIQTVFVSDSSNTVNGGSGVDTLLDVISTQNTGIDKTLSSYNATNGVLDWIIQQGYGDCQFLSLVNSINNAGNYSDFFGITKTGSTWNVEFKQSANTVSVSASDITNSSSAGDMDISVLEAAFKKLVESEGYNIDSSDGRSTGVSTNFHIVSKYVLGIDSCETLVLEPRLFEDLWNQYKNGTISNLVIGSNQQESGVNRDLGILEQHAYSVVNVTSNTVTVVNPHDTKDSITLKKDDFYSYFQGILAYGDSWDYVDSHYVVGNGSAVPVRDVSIYGDVVYAGDNDTSAQKYQYYINMYNAINEAGGCEVVPDDMINNKNWLVNMINGGFAYIKTVNKNNEWYNTSIATNTSLQEVDDKVLLRKAEAKYEADMKRIDIKDRKYDTDLAALESERNAIKQEIETLKTVAKDNVERTFKLFS